MTRTQIINSIKDGQFYGDIANHGRCTDSDILTDLVKELFYIITTSAEHVESEKELKENLLDYQGWADYIEDERRG